MSVCISFASWPGLHHAVAASKLDQPIDEPLLGRLSPQHAQLVPQSSGILTEEIVGFLADAYPATRFRLHANVRVLPMRCRADLSGFTQHSEWFRRAAQISKRLDAPAYTAHAGLRSESSIEEMLDNVRRCADLFGVPVGVEGHYPTRGDAFLVSTWEEYRQVFESKVPYALDLSHLNILAASSGVVEVAMVEEMLACERCLEVHLSANDGRGDQHQVCRDRAWWSDLLPRIHEKAVIFSEGNHRKSRSAR